MSKEKDLNLVLQTARDQIYQLTLKIQQLEDEKVQMRNEIIAELIRQFLPTIDNFERASAFVPENCKDNVILGFQSVYKGFMQSFNDLNIKEIQTNMFDNQLHEVIDKIESDKPSNTIVEVISKGYMIDNIVIREAKVIVSQ